MLSIQTLSDHFGILSDPEKFGSDIWLSTTSCSFHTHSDDTKSSTDNVLYFHYLLMHICCGTPTVAHLLWHIYCGTSTVAHLLWHIYCGTSTVAHLLWHTYCGTSTVAHLLWHIYCGTSTVVHLLWHIYCGTCVLLQKYVQANLKLSDPK